MTFLVKKFLWAGKTETTGGARPTIKTFREKDFHLYYND